MRLSDFLSQKQMKRGDFAQRISVSASYVTALCHEQPQWPGRRVALAIFTETDGAVTPNDFLPEISQRLGVASTSQSDAVS